MRGSPESLAALRRLLAERFPQAPPRPAAVLPTGVAAIDEAGDGGLPLGGITEAVVRAPSAGGQLLVSSLLAATRARRMRAALVDAFDAFDPRSHEPPLLQHLLWVRCRTLDEAMSAADILVRDANLGLLMLDLRGAAVARIARGARDRLVPPAARHGTNRHGNGGVHSGKSGNREIGKSGNGAAGKPGNGGRNRKPQIGDRKWQSGAARARGQRPVADCPRRFPAARRSGRGAGRARLPPAGRGAAPPDARARALQSRVRGSRVECHRPLLSRRGPGVAGRSTI